MGKKRKQKAVPAKAPAAKRWRFDSLLLPYYPYVRGAGPVGDILASTAADLGAGEEEEEDEKNNDEKHAEIQREFNTKLNQATICYYHAQIHQLQPANDQAVRVRAIRASGVAKLKRMILKSGFSPDSVITCFEDLEHTRKNGLTPLHQLAAEQPQTMGAVPFIHHSSDPNAIQRRLLYIDGNHRMQVNLCYFCRLLLYLGCARAQRVHHQ